MSRLPIALLFWSVPAIAAAAPAIHLFPKAVEVRLFVDTGRNDAKMRPILTPSNGRRLSIEQRTKLEKSIYFNGDYSREAVAACFIPHHFFRYFDSKHHKLGQISVCFCCNGVEVDGPHAQTIYPLGRLKADYQRLKALVHSMSEPTDVDCGDGDG